MTATPACADCGRDLVIITVHHRHMPPTKHRLCTNCFTSRQRVDELPGVEPTTPTLTVVRSA